MPKTVILIIGSTGQLGSEIKELSGQHPSFDFIFSTEEDLLIQHAADVRKYFKKVKPDYCINCAAYTAVDKAETEKDLAIAVNADAVGNMALVCAETGTKLIHISTDYVFDGTSEIPYTEESPVNPVNAYGESKLRGEQKCIHFNRDSIIIRTAWLYSAFGNNFVKTMLRLMKDKPAISVVNDQVGAPTYARDLARCILDIVVDHWEPGIYHYSNKGRISWYDFAVAIKELSGSECKVNPISSAQYPTPAKRPSFSLLDTRKIQSAYNCSIPEWKDSLQHCMKRLLSDVPA
jgi:dTDP-4-dehydrorhamnose reductase